MHGCGLNAIIKSRIFSKPSPFNLENLDLSTSNLIHYLRPPELEVAGNLILVSKFPQLILVTPAFRSAVIFTVMVERKLVMLVPSTCTITPLTGGKDNGYVVAGVPKSCEVNKSLPINHSRIGNDRS